jgi:hypothetical protein
MVSKTSGSNAEDFNKWMLLERDKKAVISGFGANGELHLGHLANITLYKIFRKRASHGSLFVSDVGAFFSRKNVTWDDIEAYRKKMVQIFKMANISSKDIFIESEQLHKILKDIKDVDYQTDLGVILTKYEIELYKSKNVVPLVVLSQDELEYANSSGIYYFVYKDLLSPFKKRKMSKSIKGININIEGAIKNNYEVTDQYLFYLKEYFSYIIKSSRGPEIVLGRIESAKNLKEIVRACLNFK